MHLLAHFGGRQPAPYEGIACASRCLPLCVILSGAIAESNRKARHRRGILHGINTAKREQCLASSPPNCRWLPQFTDWYS